MDDTQSNNKCLKCDGEGYTEILSGWQRPCDVCYGEGYLRQPQTDALKAENERLTDLLRRVVNLAEAYATGTGEAFNNTMTEARAALEARGL